MITAPISMAGAKKLKQGNILLHWGTGQVGIIVDISPVNTPNCDLLIPKEFRVLVGQQIISVISVEVRTKFKHIISFKKK